MRWEIGILIMLLGFVDLNAQQNSIATESENPMYEFVANRGQWHPLVLYRASFFFFVTQRVGFMIKATLEGEQLVNPNFANAQLGDSLHRNFFDLKTYTAAVTYRGDKLKFYARGGFDFREFAAKHFYRIDGQTSLKYEWIIQRPTLEKINQIKLNIDGADSINIIDNQLNIYTSVGVISDEKPFTYQLINGKKIEIASSYHLDGNILGYQVLSDFDPDYPLIIDPKLIFSTYSV